MHYLHMIRTDPSWYLQKLWWTAVLFGGIFMVVVACKNRSRNRKRAKAAEAAKEVKVVKPDPRDRWGSGL